MDGNIKAWIILLFAALFDPAVVPYAWRPAMVWKSLFQHIESLLDGSHRKAEVAMIGQRRPQYGDLVITKISDGFWIHRPPFLVLDDGDESHTPSKVDTLEAAVASGGLIAYIEQVDLWLMDGHTQFLVLVNGRKQAADKTAGLAN